MDPGDNTLSLYDTSTSPWTLSSTLTLTSTLGTVNGINGAAVKPSDNTIFILYKIDGISGRRLGTLNTSTAEISDIGDLGIGNMSSLTYGAVYGLLGISGDGNTPSETFYTINETTGVATLLFTSSEAGDDGEALGFNPDDNFYYRWSGWGDDDVVMEQLDPNNSLSETTITLSGDIITNVGAALYLGSDEFLCSSNNDLTFFKINTSGVVSALPDAPIDIRSKAIIAEDNFLNINTFTLDTFKVYPNPTQTNLTIDGLKKDEIVKLYGLDGKLYLESKINITNNKVDISHFQPGIYLIEINNSVKQVIKQ